MLTKPTLLLEATNFNEVPFPHFSSERILKDDLARDLLEWLKATSLWHYTETNFYTQYEFSLLDLGLPPQLKSLSDQKFIQHLKQHFYSMFKTDRLELVGITVHKLVDGYKMGVHNDFIGKEESHRLVVQLNDGWTEVNGGYLMLFNSMNVNDLAKLIKPLHNTGIGFEISNASYHAVSTVHDFERYTLVYTFSERL